MRRMAIFLALLIAAAGTVRAEPAGTGERLRDWRTGVWLLSDGSYAIYTDTHYFVVSVGGDSARTNLYCGASKILMTNGGMAREQRIRIRQMPGGTLEWFKNPESAGAETGIPSFNESLFQPGTCTIADGVIYDSITEATDEYILLSTCNGDREKIFSDGRAVYLPSGGGEYWEIRIERFGR